MRQSDKTFSGILTKIGNGDELSSDERLCIEERFRSRHECEEIGREAVRLFHKNADVDEYNRSVISAQWNSIAVDVYSGYAVNDQLVSARTFVHRLQTNKTGNLPYMLPLALNEVYMLTCNLCVEDRMVNGAIGVLRHVDVKQSDEESASSSTGVLSPHVLWLEFMDDSIAGQMTRCKYRALVLSRPELRSTWTPIQKRKVSFPVTKQIKCARVNFPMSPAAALTTHKSQGCTFDKIVFEYDRKQSPQLVYVAMSRVKSIEGLYITNRDGDYRFHHAQPSLQLRRTWRGFWNETFRRRTRLGVRRKSATYTCMCRTLE